MKIKTIFPGILVFIFFFGISTQSFSQDKKEAQVFEKVEVMPLFEGKDLKQFNTWVMKNIVYPKDALKEGVSGKVFANFVVAVDGSVKDVKIKKGVSESIDNEVLRVIKSSPAWTPGYNKGKAVEVSITIPVEFKLSN